MADHVFIQQVKTQSAFIYIILIEFLKSWNGRSDWFLIIVQIGKLSLRVFQIYERIDNENG